MSQISRAFSCSSSRVCIRPIWASRARVQAPIRSVPTCEALCKTRAPKANTDAAPAGVVGAQQTNPTGFDTFYHVCKRDDSGANVCPVGPGETIISPCGCLDDFPEAVVMMQTVRLAGADLVCTARAR